MQFISACRKLVGNTHTQCTCTHTLKISTQSPHTHNTHHIHHTHTHSIHTVTIHTLTSYAHSLHTHTHFIHTLKIPTQSHNTHHIHHNYYTHTVTVTIHTVTSYAHSLHTHTHHTHFTHCIHTYTQTYNSWGKKKIVHIIIVQVHILYICYFVEEWSTKKVNMRVCTYVGIRKKPLIRV